MGVVCGASEEAPGHKRSFLLRKSFQQQEFNFFRFLIVSEKFFAVRKSWR
jgi:hypothetical protein